MTRRRDKHLIEIRQPFAIVIEPSPDGRGWDGKILGLPESPMYTCADTAENVAYMVWDILRMLTGRCSFERPRHEYAIDTMMGPSNDIPAWGCAHCDIRTAKSAFVDDETVH